ncbi:hypothetical protein [Intrasporangium flavum]|uniref:hypothetical protein n=1 Tax=Intrasporangium flavum TaxID=1428657 RepID=UPI00096C77B8|nr:hypothetical protein [Intrasporangium flavum]
MAELMRELFAPEPEQWGLRGDPWVWEAMRSRLAETPVPSSREAAERLLKDTFRSIVGVDVTADPLPEGSQQVYREEFAHGGMSSGYVDVAEWQRRLIPLLVSRAGASAAVSIPDTHQVGAHSDVIRAEHAGAFEAAWREMAEQCHDTVAPEATYQAWLAHFTINRLGPLHVVREVDFGARYLGPAAAAHFRPVGNLMVDMLVLRQPIVHLPRRAALGARDLPDGAPNPRSGLSRLADFSVITELKVSATQRDGLDYGEVVRDFRKLSVILDAAEKAHPGSPLPAAYVGVFANADKPRLNFGLLQRKLRGADLRSDVLMAAFDSATGDVSFESAAG